MCGRYELELDIEQLMLRFDALNRYIGYGTKKEIFPTDKVAVIINDSGRNSIDAAKWGFDNPYDSRPLINARGETVHEKKTFKNMFTHGRCLIPATAFFEWRKNTDGTKTKTRISVKDTAVFCMAGLYKQELKDNGETVIRCAIITTNANEAMREIHDRMPVILPPEIEKIWLDNSIYDVAMLKEFLKPYSGMLALTVD